MAERLTPAALLRLGLTCATTTLSLVACALPPAPPQRNAPAAATTGGTDPLSGTTWSLVTYADAQGATQAALPDVDARLTFRSGRVAGTAGCNRLNGAYQVSGSSLTFGPAASTMMACPEPQMQQEAGVTAALANVASFEISGDQLVMKDATGATVLTFTTYVPISLTGREWTMVMVNNGKQAVASALPGVTVTATFAEDGMVSGSSGCNSYGGTYTIDGNAISFGPLAGTEKLCTAEGVMEQERAYLDALSRTTRYEIDGTRLDLYSESGARQVTYRAGE
jgi:heat shock protein HslJ